MSAAGQVDMLLALFALGTGCVLAAPFVLAWWVTRAARRLHSRRPA